MFRWLMNWRQLIYERREGEYCRQISVLAPKGRQRLKLPKVRPLHAVKDNVEEFRKSGTR